MWTVRRFDFRKDIRAIMKIENSVFGEDAFPPLEFLYLQQIGKKLFLVLSMDEEILGYISAYVQADKGYIASIAVDTKFRRRGIAKQLMEDVISEIKIQESINSIELHVRQSNHGAIIFYKGLGFSISDVEEGYYPDENAFIMELCLLN